MNRNTLFGWTSEQWDKAQAYYNLCNKDAPVRLRSFFAVATDTDMRLEDHMRVMEFWESRRTDAPGGVEITVVPVYRARAQA